MKRYEIRVIFWKDVRHDGFVDWHESILNHTIKRYAMGLKDARQAAPVKVSWSHNEKAFTGYSDDGGIECIIQAV